jgi:hypothetical protein
MPTTLNARSEWQCRVAHLCSLLVVAAASTRIRSSRTSFASLHSEIKKPTMTDFESILKVFPEVDFAFAYGSGVFAQKSYVRSNGATIARDFVDVGDRNQTTSQ